MDAAVYAAVNAKYNAAQSRPPQAATPPDPEFMVDFIGAPTDTADVGRRGELFQNFQRDSQKTKDYNGSQSLFPLKTKYPSSGLTLELVTLLKPAEDK